MKKRISVLVVAILVFSLILTTVFGATDVVRRYLYEKDNTGNYHINSDRTITMTGYPVTSEPSNGWILISDDYELPVVVGKDEKVSVIGTVYYYREEEKNYISEVSGNEGMVNITSEDYYKSENTMIEISNGVSSESELNEDLNYECIDGTVTNENIIFNSKDFNIKYETTYYNVRLITETETVTVKMKVIITAGDVETYAFQINTNTEEGAVSEFSPSFRVINRSSKIVTKPTASSENKQVYVVKSYGTIYTVNSDVTKEDMVLNSGNDEIKTFECTEEGKLVDWKYAVDNESYYYAITFRSINYYMDMLDMKYTIRAYAITEDGDFVLGKNVCSTSIYDIAQLLYNNVLMDTYEAHNFLYDNVLNIVAIKNNYLSIAQSMIKALNIQDKSNLAYYLVNNTYKDLYHYVRLDKLYSYEKYTQRKTFSPKTETVYNKEKYITESSLLELLNAISGNNYETVADWIYYETEKYGYVGFYKKKDFSSGNTLVYADSE